MNEMKKKLVDYINCMGVDEKLALHNAYCDAANRADNRIYAMDDMEEILYGVDKWELVRMIRFGDFDFMKDFWGFNGYGNLDSYNAWELPIFASDIADYILSNGDALENDEIQELLDEDEDDDDGRGHFISSYDGKEHEVTVDGERTISTDCLDGGL